MADNSTTSNNSNLSSSIFSCSQIHPYSIILPTLVFSIILFLLPLYVFVIHHGLQQWMKKSSSSSSAAAISHSDCFTYNMVLMELVAVSGYVLQCLGLSKHNDIVVRMGLNVIRSTWFGKLSLHLLTCVERYLAVVHPITYMRLKNCKWTRIRNVTIVCVWLISGAFAPLPHELVSLVSSLYLVAVSFCSFSVLEVLVRPGPGEQGGNRQWADPSKKRAFFTIVAILGVLVLKLSADISYFIMWQLDINAACVFLVYMVLLELPNSLVLPLLFLLKHGGSNEK